MRHLVLVGGMAAGKTTVGRVLARRLGWSLRDSDADLEAVEGRSAREIDEAAGTAGLHELEARHLLGALGAPGPSVIAAAASVADAPACLAALRDPALFVVWLTVSPAVAATRFAAQAHRPRHGTDPERFLGRLAARREAAWRSLDALEVDTDRLAPDEIAARILEAARTDGTSGR